jgi:hypothetical protein
MKIIEKKKNNKIITGQYTGKIKPCINKKEIVVNVSYI